MACALAGAAVTGGGVTRAQSPGGQGGFPGGPPGPGFFGRGGPMVQELKVRAAHGRAQDWGTHQAAFLLRVFQWFRSERKRVEDADRAKREAADREAALAESRRVAAERKAEGDRRSDEPAGHEEPLSLGGHGPDARRVPPGMEGQGRPVRTQSSHAKRATNASSECA